MSVCLLDLPDECLFLILAKLELEPHKLCQIAKVCKRFYQVSFDPRLWRIADFQFSDWLYSRKGPIPKEKRKRIMPEAQRRKLFANFLVSRKALLTHLGIHCKVGNEMEELRPLFDTCCTKDLKYFEMEWVTASKILSFPEAKVQLLREYLQKLSAQCPQLYFVQSQLNGSCTTAEIIGTMSNVRHMTLAFPFLQEQEGTNSIEIILSNLKKLKKLEINIPFQVESNVEFTGCKLVSKSLRYFDCSGSVAFPIQYIDLPKLHTFLAFDLLPYIYRRMFKQDEDFPCLFELIEEGCPNLTKLNGRKSIISGLENFPLTDDHKRDMYMCRCNDHNPWN